MLNQHQDLLSLRQQEKNYEREIKNTYKDYQHLFVTNSSDLLHLNIAEREDDTNKYKVLITTSQFKKYDFIAEIRGSIISYEKLNKIIGSNMVDQKRLPLLLYLNHEREYVLSPKNIGKYLFTNPIYQQINTKQNDPSRNCYIENHFGSKLFAIANRDINAGEQLILEQKNYNRIIYKYNAFKF